MKTKVKPKKSAKRTRVIKRERVEAEAYRQSSERVIAQIAESPDFTQMPDLSCVDWELKIEKGKSLMPPGLFVHQENHDLAIQLFNKLKIPDVVGTPSFGEVGGVWFSEIVGAVFGTWNGVRRLVNEFFLLVPKKNSKTTNSAGIMVTALLRNKRPQAEYLLIAPTQKISNLAYSQAAGMLNADEELRPFVTIKDYKKEITKIKDSSKLQIKSFDTNVLTGTKPCGTLLDELHVISEHNNADRVLGQLRGGLISQPEGFLIMITTQSERVPKGVFRSELLNARKIRDGEIKQRVLPILYEFPERLLPTVEYPERSLWRDSKYWWMVTPNNGRSITVERLMEEWEKSKSKGEEEVRRWASQHLNVEVGLALRSDHWVGAKMWLKCNDSSITLESLIERSEIITVGIDGGGLDDMLGLAVVGRDKETKEWLAWAHAWIHRIGVERRPDNAQQYKDFSDDGDLTIVDDLGRDLEELGDIVEQVVESKKFDKVGVDAAGIGSVIEECMSRGVKAPEEVVAIPQGWRLAGSIKTTERKLGEKKLKIATQALTRWCAENARVEPKGNAILITKQASGTAKIDPLMAILNAVELMSRNPAPKEVEYKIHLLGDAA